MSTLARLLYSRPRVRPARLTKAVRNRIVLITGASHGIGRRTAAILADAGAIVLLLARSAHLLDELVTEITARGGQAHAYPVDLSDFDAVQKVAERVLAGHRRIDVIVHNAGQSIRRSIDLSCQRFDDFQRLTDVNYLGPVRLTLGLLPAMRAAGAGRIVSVSTFAVRMPPFPRWGAYQASKASFDVWLRSLAPEISGDGIRIVPVYLGLVDTRMSVPLLAARRVPALPVDDAAHAVCVALCTRRSSLGPWWCLPVQLGASVVARPLQTIFARLYRRSQITTACPQPSQVDGLPANRAVRPQRRH